MHSNMVLCVGHDGPSCCCCFFHSDFILFNLFFFIFMWGWHGAWWLVFIFHNISQNGYYWSEVKWILCAGHAHTIYWCANMLKLAIGSINDSHICSSCILMMMIQTAYNIFFKCKPTKMRAQREKTTIWRSVPNQFTMCMHRCRLSHPLNVYVPYVCSIARTHVHSIRSHIRFHRFQFIFANPGETFLPTAVAVVASWIFFFFLTIHKIHFFMAINQMIWLNKCIV